MKRVIIVGSNGQDGSYLFDRLAEDSGTFLLGVGPDAICSHGKLTGYIAPASVDVLDAGAVATMIERLQPQEIYYLAAHHHSAEDRGATRGTELFRRSYETHVLGVVNILEAIAPFPGRVKFFYAASSHVFGDPPTMPQDERTALAPQCVYGITKASGIRCCQLYRRSHGVHTCVGILYNHESPRRRADFLTRKITRAAVAISRGLESQLVVGDLSARVDWGYAPDFVDAMIRIMGQPRADDYVVATGHTHTVEDLVSAAFTCVNLDWRPYVRADRSLIAKSRSGGIQLVGDASKLRAATGWSPSVKFEEMVGILIRAELNKDR